MRSREDMVIHTVKVDKVKRPCKTCRTIIANEPYCIKETFIGNSRLTKEIRCWRCWHTERITDLFMQNYPKLFHRAKMGRWYYLKMVPTWLHFPSTDGEHEPDW